jgi:N-acetylglucosamine-6-phosphate deacetylase
MLEGLQPPKRIRACKVRALLQKLEPKDQEILKKALADESWGNITLTEALNERGIEISENPVRRHRIGKCSCNA